MGPHSGSLVRTGSLLALAALLAACGASKDDPEFGGLQFRGGAKPVGDDRANFVVTISNAARAPYAAADAGIYEGTKYCIHYLGTSDIAWAMDPAAVRRQPVLSGSDLVLRGRCVE